MFAFSSTRFCPVPFVAKWYILQQKCLKDKWELACNEHAGTTFSPVHRPWEPQCTTLRTDRLQDAAHRRSYYVAVRSAKKNAAIVYIYNEREQSAYSLLVWASYSLATYGTATRVLIDYVTVQMLPYPPRYCTGWTWLFFDSLRPINLPPLTWRYNIKNLMRATKTDE